VNNSSSLDEKWLYSAPGDSPQALVRSRTEVSTAPRSKNSAAEVASLGEAFGVAVQRFAESGDRLGAHLERVDVALGAQMERSDEQLAYYVAQAREVIDLSILSQKQIIEELQRLAGRREAEAQA